mmetsp:Transcript_18366/g.41533  ORF Transcript_18366/g.41533 Transcript_18366/m.41533 type:complete len:214 (+) Transcript_18366:98-739(+)
MAEDIIAQLDQAEAFKQQGNAFFKEGNFKRALGNYHKVFCYVNGLQMPGESNQVASCAQMMGRSVTGGQVPKERVEEVKRLKQSTHLNMAACYLKMGAHQKCVESCSKALADGDLPKAYFRRGQAHLELRNLDEAKEDLQKTLALEPDDKATEQQLKRLKQAYAQHDAKEKKRFARMFSKMAEQEPEGEASQKAPEAPEASEAPKDGAEAVAA